MNTWKCKRCNQIVDMAAKKCACADSPSPWELAINGRKVFANLQTPQGICGQCKQFVELMDHKCHNDVSAFPLEPIADIDESTTIEDSRRVFNNCRRVKNSELVVKELQEWGNIAYDESNGFIEKFCPKAWILTSVSWDSENMRIVYILSCGQHVSDSFKMSEWLDFLEGL